MNHIYTALHRELKETRKNGTFNPYYGIGDETITGLPAELSNIIKYKILEMYKSGYMEYIF